MQEVEMKVMGIAQSVPDGHLLMVLQSKKDHTVLPITLDLYSANAIQFALHKTRFPRPLTHDLLMGVIQALGAKLTKVVITELKGETFFSVLHLEIQKTASAQNTTVTIDARPSDAVALALRAKVKIYAARELLGNITFADSPAMEQMRQEWFESLDPDDLLKE